MSDGLPGADVFDQQNPLDGLQIAGSNPPAVPQPAADDGAPADQSPLDSFGEITPTNVVPQETSAFGAAARGAERGLLPAGGSLAAAGTGAELGGAIGEVAGPVGAGVGAVVGGIGGAIAGGRAVETAQNWLLSKLPSGFVDALGLDEAKERIDQQEHPVASFVGGLVPYAVTMSPNLAIKSAAKLPENATALQRLMSNPITAKLFGGGVMGGMELTGELDDHEDLDWRKIGIATGFGMIFNKPNRLGEAITERGAGPVRAALGRPSPTVAQAGDLKVMGPGITEQVFQGTQEQAPQAAMVAQETARAENPEPQEPGVGAVARQMEPELFGHYDELLKRREAFSAWMGEGPEQLSAGDHLARTNAEIESMSPEIAAAYRRAADTIGTETIPAEPFKSFAEMLAARDKEGSQAPIEGATAPAGIAPSPPRSIAEQRAFIADDVAQRLTAAGRPQDEAQAAGQLIAARYVTRAGRFEGKLGSPEQLYARESAEIAGQAGGPSAPRVAPQPIPTRGPAGRDANTFSLLEFLASQGGIRSDDPMISDLRQSFGGGNKFLPGFGKLIREPKELSAAAKAGGAKAPMTLDDALRAAIDAGYLHEEGRVTGGENRLTPNDLLDMIDKEARGNRRYKEGFIPEGRESDEHFEAKKSELIGDLENHLKESGGSPLTEAEKARAIELWHREGLNDTTDIIERLALEADDGEIGAGAPGREPVQDYDTAYEPGSAPEEGGAVAGEQPEQPGGAASRSGGESAGSRYDRFVADKSERDQRIPIAKGFNDHATRNGAPVRAQASQEWVPGNVVDSGFVKNLVVAKQNADGSFTLLGKPDKGGQSQSYNARPHEGLSKEGKVDFLEATHGLMTPVEAEEFAQNDREYEQIARGKIRLRPGKRPVITLLKDANASTFIHESGHQFLEEMLSDAAHPEAPDVVKQDADTVKQWLGVGPDGEIQTKHHEKFARGFEQYMREGVAPSQGLARVFAQFRNWMFSIYQSLKGLGQEISPEIREVFDRMLELEPQRTVIAPERAQPDLLHDIHEAEAATTEPHEAEPAMDRVIAERDRYIQDQPPEIVRELEIASAKIEAAEAGAAGEGAEPAGEASAGGGGSSTLEPSGAGPRTEPGGGAGSEEHGAVEPSSGDAGTEGNAGAAGADLRSELGDQPGTALAPGPADLFGPRESPLVDKAGNIRIDNLNVPEDVAQAIRVAAQENNDFIGDRRGVITDGQVLDLADALGMDAEDLNRRQLGQAFNAEQIVAARRLLIQSATTVSEAMKKAATGSDADVMAYAQAKDRHQMIQAHVAGITAEAGRALRAFRSMAGMEQAKEIGLFIQEATGKTLYQLRAEAKLGAELQTPQQVSKMMHDATKHSFGRMVLEYWINGLISGPATHMTYAVGNTISSLLRIPEQFAAAGVSRAAQALGREGVGVRPGEAGAMARGLVRSIPGAIKAGIGGLETGLTTQLPGEAAGQGNLFQSGVGAPAQFHEDATYHDAMAAAFGMIRGMRDGILATGKLLAAGGVHGEPLVGTQYSPLGAIPDITYRGVNVLPVGSVVRAPGRFIAAIHSFYRAVNFSMEKNALAYRHAVGEGLEGEALDARVAQLRADPSEHTMNEIATRGATQTVLMGKGSELTQALSRLTNTPIFGFPLLKFVDPFVHISGNVIEQGVLQRTPAGLLTLFSPETELARDLRGANGAASQDKAIGRMLVGSALSITFGGLAAQGLMSGSGPSDPKEAAMWRQAGNQAHSVRVGDIWYSVNRLGPLGMLAGISADLFDVAHQAEKGEFLQAAAHLQHAFTQNILDESFMRGPADLIQAVEDPGRYGEAYVRNFLSSFVPFSVGMSQMARATDPYSRQARTLTDAIKAKVPGLSETLFPRRDVWGEPMPSREVLGAPGVSAIYMTRMNNDPVNKAMLDLNIYPAQVERKIVNVQLTPREYDDYARIAGRMTKADLDRIVNSPAWNQMPVEAKHYAIQHTIEMDRNTAREMMKGKYPRIPAEATIVKQKRARGERP